MSPYGFSGSISAEGRCRRASTTGCYLPASPPRVLLVEQQAPLEFLLESNSLCDFTSHLAAWHGFDRLHVDHQHFDMALQQGIHGFPSSPLPCLLEPHDSMLARAANPTDATRPESSCSRCETLCGSSHFLAGPTHTPAPFSSAHHILRIEQKESPFSLSCAYDFPVSGCADMGEPEESFSSPCSRTDTALLAWATMRGSSAHPDQSLMLAHAALLRRDLWVRTSVPILSFFTLGGVSIHDGL